MGRGCWEVVDLTEPDLPEGRGPITWSDIAHFEPTVDVHGMEPDGWIVVGLPTNFFATGGPHTESGQLLGHETSVRFQPERWTWNYGDGETRTSSTPGATWRELHLDEFEETATSHTFAERGRYTITLTIEYSASYQFAGSDWVPIDGTLNVESDPITATAVRASTVLVDKDCEENPKGPGC